MSEKFKVSFSVCCCGLSVFATVVSFVVDFLQFLELLGLQQEATAMLAEWIPRLMVSLAFGVVVGVTVYWTIPYWFGKLSARTRLSIPAYRKDFLKSVLYPAAELALQLLQEYQDDVRLVGGIPQIDPYKFSMYTAQLKTVAQLLSEHGMPVDSRFSRIEELEAGLSVDVGTRMVAWEWFLPLLVFHAKLGNLSGVRIVYESYRQQHGATEP